MVCDTKYVNGLNHDTIALLVLFVKLQLLAGNGTVLLRCAETRD